MNVVDSSGWLEYFAGGPNARYFTPAIEDADNLVVPTLSLAEVFQRILRQSDESDAFRAVALMQQSLVVPLDATLAVDAARLGAENKLPLADSVILATALRHEATLWTQDADFKGLPGVRYRARRS